jgi:hypothetical protein
VGAPLVGWISQTSSPRVALAVGAFATVSASTVTLLRHRHEHRRIEAMREVDEAAPGTELGVA